jgi:hypothetical protein
MLAPSQCSPSQLIGLKLAERLGQQPQEEIDMTQVTQYSLPDGSIVFVEAAERLSLGGEQRAAAIESIGKYLRGDSDADKAPSLAERVSPIIQALKVVKEKLVEVGSPHSVELEAGIKFTAEAGVILSKYGGEASISVKLKWQKEQEKGAEATA